MTTPDQDAAEDPGAETAGVAAPDPGTPVEAPVTRAAVAAHYAVLKLRCRGPAISEAARAEVGVLLAEGELEAARQLDARNRKGCGQDVGALILAGPLDGQPREVDCPRCGITIRYTPPAVED